MTMTEDEKLTEENKVHMYGFTRQNILVLLNGQTWISDNTVFW